MEFQKPDGTIKVATSGCTCCPPGEKGEGMHTNATSTWWHAGDGWNKLPRTANVIDIHEYAGASETCQEFKELMSRDNV